MALLDNKEYVLSFIRNAFVACDDTEMCEHVFENNGYLKSRRINKNKSKINDEENTDSELPDSLEIIANMDIDSHRMRSDTAQRLERLKRDKHRLSQIQHITWDQNFDEADGASNDHMFTRKEIVKHEGERVSLLTKQLEHIMAIPQNPFNEYIKFDGKSSSNTAPVKKLSIFLMMVSERDRPYPLNVCCLASARVREFIGLICWHYTCSGLQPALHKTAQAYALHIAEDDGQMDRDFPALDFNESMSKYGFTRLALVERDRSLWSNHHCAIITVHMPARGFAKFPIEDTTIKMKEILNMVLTKRRIVLKNGIDYRLEEHETPGAVIDLDLPLNAMPTFNFYLIRKNSARGREVEPSAGEEQESCDLIDSLTSQQYKSYEIDQMLRFWKRIPVHLGVSGDKIEVESVERVGRVSKISPPWRQKFNGRHSIPMNLVVNCCLLEPRNPDKAMFRFDYICSSPSTSRPLQRPMYTLNASTTYAVSSTTNNHVNQYKHMTFECRTSMGYEIVRKICYCIDQQIEMGARKAFLDYKLSQKKK